MVPAARLGDITVHGGVIVQGSFNVLTNMRPAARLMDNHVCFAFNGVQPHVGGPICKASGSVLINARPAARVTDLAICAGPTDVIAMGSPDVMIGG